MQLPQPTMPTCVAETTTTAVTISDKTTFATTTPVFHWPGGTDHVLTATASKIDIISFFTLGGDDPTIYGSITGQNFAT